MNATLTVTALADVNVELPVNGLARDLDLELLRNVGFVQGAAAVGANVRQGGLVRLVYLVERGWLAVRLGAIILAGLAARLAGVRFGFALREGPCLAFAGTGGSVELPTEPLVFGLQVADSSLERFAVGTQDRFHAEIIRSS